MSFFGDLKAITKASAKAVSDGVELFADLAEEFSQSSEKMLISTRLDVVVRARALSAREFFTAQGGES